MIMRRLYVLVLSLPVLVVTVFATDAILEQPDHLALYLVKESGSGPVTYRLQDKVLSLDSVLVTLKRILKHDDGQFLEIIAADKVQVQELTQVLRELSQAGWRKVRLNGLLDGELTNLVYRVQSLAPVAEQKKESSLPPSADHVK
jgi:biopolymer transport protein ExbD